MFERQARLNFLRTPSLLVLSAVLLLGATGCDRVGERTKDVINSISMQNLSNGQKRLANQESDVELTLPQGWVDVQNLRSDADLYAAREDRTMYVMVLADPRGSEVGSFVLADNADQYLSFLDRGMTQEQAKVPTSMTSLNGMKALQYEVKGRVDNVPVVYLHTTVEGSTNYYQVVAWTTAENYSAAKGELQTVIQSFRGT
ncbi:hypothetical protein [Leptothoe sp. PORK10 BA2]|uniref:hypothetical protein n=1 Tax=Leptothoe sp. PORK10 BA2 TaxID=3110254 RepID=UPI002B21E0DE|nr:hypothetical protein [Leptothoe sp. PORK10 BA2]MEA5465479.1 hypothetical protein [Leptothoe sp. PORK10 BA2]